MNESDLAATPTKGTFTPTARGVVEVVEDGGIQPLVSHFLANITNEFRTPLAALNASVEYLLDDLDMLSKNEIRELLQSIHLSLTGLHTLIENLIESTNIEAGHFIMRTGAIDLRAVVVEAVCFTRPLTNRRLQHVIVNQPAILPFVKGDPTRLTQVMVNLLSAASKLGPMNEPVYLTVEPIRHHHLRVMIANRQPNTDSGAVGEAPAGAAGWETIETQPYSIDLGLSVAKTIIREHGGTIGLEQSAGGDLIFWFTLPTVEHQKGG